MDPYNFKYYAIITGSRTGSSHLCDLLESTNRLGHPNEYFNTNLVPYFLEHNFPPTNQSYIDKVKWYTMKKNFVVGVKVNHVDHLYEMYDQGVIDHFKYWIWLRREDKILQAISRYKAWVTNVWDWTHIDEYADKKLKYDGGDIKNIYDSIIEEEKWIELFLKDRNYMEVHYETDLQEYPDQTVISILNFLDIPTEYLPDLRSSQKVMRDIESYEWKERFIKEYPEVIS